MLSATTALYTLAAIVLAIPFYLSSGLLWSSIRQCLSPLRMLTGPKPSSWFLGSLREMHDSENNNLIERWVDQHGSTFVYKGFCGVRVLLFAYFRRPHSLSSQGSRLLTTDTRAIAHILSNASNYPKPSFVRAGLATMGGEQGLVVVEGMSRFLPCPLSV